MNRLSLLLVPMLGIVLACTGGPPEVPQHVTRLTATHDHEGELKHLTLDTTKLMECLASSRSLGIGEAQKCVTADSDYDVVLNDGETVITIHSATQFTIDHQGFFSNECLYPMLAEAAHGEPPTPGGC